MSTPLRAELLALLDDVKENPDDLTPWLVLTDWLEENGDEAERARAEYCRLCFDKLGKKTYASDWEKGERRRDLFREYRERWFGGLSPSFAQGPYGSLRCEIKRGLVHVSSSGSELRSAVETGVPAEFGAWVEVLDLHTLSSDDLTWLATCPLLDGPGEVKLQATWRQPFSHKALNTLAQSSYLRHVRALYVLEPGARKKGIRMQSLKARFGNRLHLG